MRYLTSTKTKGYAMTKEEAEQKVIEAAWAYSRATVNHVNAVKKAIETGSTPLVTSRCLRHEVNSMNR